MRIADRLSPKSSRVLTLITCAVILGVGVLAFRLSLSRDRAREAVGHSRDVLRASQGLLLGLVDAETGERGFLLTNRVEYLQPYHGGVQTGTAALQWLRLLTADTPADHPALALLGRLSAAKVAEMDRAIEVRQQAGESAAVALVLTQNGKHLMDSIRAVVSTIMSTEQRLLIERQVTERRARTALLVGLSAGTLLAAILAWLAGAATSTALRRQRELNAELSTATQQLHQSAGQLARSNEALHLANEELEATNEELTALNEELEATNEELLSVNDELTSSNTQLQAAREEVEASHRILQSVIEGTPDCVFLKDRSLRYIVVNSARAQVLGGTPEQVIGRTDQELFPPEILQWLVPQDHRIMAGGRTEVVEEQMDVGGRPRWYLTTKSPWRDERGAVIGLIGVARDITDRREMELRMRQVGRLEAVGRLGGGVAHEVNNQMTVVLGCAEFLLRRDGIPDAVRNDLLSIQRAAERSAKITSQLLAFSRRQFFQPRALDVNVVIEEFAPVLRRTLAETHRIELRLGDTPLRVQADPGQLEQILLNLTINAVDAMPQGGVLRVSTTRIALTGEYVQLKPDVVVRPGGYVALIVSDTGHGMDRETLANAFEPFFTTKPVGKGTGLGLSSVYGIVKQSGGYIWLYSEPGGGTTVKMYLPEVGADDPAPAAVAGGKPSLSRGRILVAEDDPTVRAMMRRALRDAGFELVEAADGREALESVRADASPFDLVITDVAMPAMDGCELARQLATIRPSLPVLAISGYTEDDIIRRSLLDPAQPFLQKPFSPERLVATVRELLETRGPLPPGVSA